MRRTLKTGVEVGPFVDLWLAKARSIVVGVALLAHHGIAQTGNDKPLPAFDVVSLHLVPERTITYPGGSSTGKPTRPCQYMPDRVRCQLSLTSLLLEAKQVKKAQIVRPQWMDDDVVALEGTMPLNTSQATARLMLQTALAERMGLKIHREKREMTIYEMVPAKGGLKLLLADEPSQRKRKTVDLPSGSISAPVEMRPGDFFANAITIDDLANMIQPCYGSEVPVANFTGAADGEYKFNMQWTPGDPNPDCVYDEGFAGALESQYGIRIEKRKAQMDVLVVDQVNRAPTDN